MEQANDFLEESRQIYELLSDKPKEDFRKPTLFFGLCFAFLFNAQWGSRDGDMRKDGGPGVPQGVPPSEHLSTA